MQHHVPVIGRKGWLSSLPWQGYDKQATHIKFLDRGQKRMVLWRINGGFVYAPCNKNGDWIRSRLLSHQIVPFNPEKVMLAEVKADTASYENGMQAVRDSLKSIMAEAHTYPTGKPDVKATLKDIPSSFTTLSEAIRNDLEQRYGGRSINEVILDDVRDGKAEVTIENDIASHRTVDVKLRDGTTLHIPGKPLPLTTLAQEAGLGWTPIRDPAESAWDEIDPNGDPADILRAMTLPPTGLNISDWIGELVRSEWENAPVGTATSFASKIGRMVYEETRRRILADRALLIDTLINDAHGAAVAAGWYKDPTTGLPVKRNFGEMIALAHSELSEALEAHRKNLMDDKLPQYKGTKVELIDGVIRHLDTLGMLQDEEPEEVSIGQIYVDKRDFNDHRADHKMENRAKDGGKAY